MMGVTMRLNKGPELKPMELKDLAMGRPALFVRDGEERILIRSHIMGDPIALGFYETTQPHQTGIMTLMSHHLRGSNGFRFVRYLDPDESFTITGQSG